MMISNLEWIRKELISPSRRKKVAARAAKLIAEEMTLQQLRRARQITQVRMAKALGINQDGISKLEKAERPSAFDSAEDRRSHGRKPVPGS
jgi:DNA-binding XRE family transcriptional regulator